MASTPTVVQSVPKTTTTAGTTLQLTGLSTTAGNVYMVAIGCRANSAVVTGVTDSAGNTWQKLIARTTGTANDVEIWATKDYSPAAITSVTVTTGSSVPIVFRFFELHGANPPMPFVGSASSAAANTALTTTAAPSSWPSSCLAFAAGNVAFNTQSVYGTTQAFTEGAPDAIVPSQTTADLSNVVGSETMLQCAYRGLSTTAAQTYSTTLTSSNGWAAAIVLIEPASLPTVVQSVPKTLAATANTAQLTGLTTTAGNLYAVVVGMRNTGGVSSVTDSAGNAWVRLVEAHGVNSNAAEIWTTTSISPAAITSVTVNTTNICGFAFRFFEIAGANNAFPGDGTAGSAAKNQNLTTGATATPSAAGLALTVSYAGSANTGEFGTAQAFTSSPDLLPLTLPAVNNTDLSNIASNQAEIQSSYLLGVTVAQTHTATLAVTTDAWAAVIAIIKAAPVSMEALPPVVLQAAKRAGSY